MLRRDNPAPLRTFPAQPSQSLWGAIAGSGASVSGPFSWCLDLLPSVGLTTNPVKRECSFVSRLRPDTFIVYISATRVTPPGMVRRSGSAPFEAASHWTGRTVRG